MRESEEEDKFAEEWRKAFEDAELPPSPVVWSEIESRLNTKSGWRRLNNPFVGRGMFLFFVLSVITGYYGLYLPQQTTQSKQQTSNKTLPKKQNSSLQSNKEKSFKNTESEKQAQSKMLGENTTIQNLKPKQAKQAKVTYQNSTFTQNNSNFPPFGLRDNQSLALSPLPQRKTLAKEDTSTKPTQTLGQRADTELLEITPIQYIEQKPLLLLGLNDIGRKFEIDSAAFAAPKNKAKVRQPSRLSFEMAFAPVITNLNQQLDYESYLSDYLRLHNIQNVNIDNFFADLKENTKYKSAFAVSAKFVYALNNRLKLRAGFAYHSLQTQLETNAFFINEQNEAIFVLSNQLNREDIRNVNIARVITTNSSYNPNVYHPISLNNYNDSKSILLEQHAQYLKIPIEIGNSFSYGRNFSHTLWAGLNLDLLLGNTTHYAALNNSTTKVSVHKALNTSFSLRWQGNYHLNKQWKIFVEPFYERGIGNFAKADKYLHISPQSYGIGIGINRKF